MPQHEFKLTPEILAWLSKPLFSLSADGQVLAHGRPLPDRAASTPQSDAGLLFRPDLPACRQTDPQHLD